MGIGAIIAVGMFAAIFGVQKSMPPNKVGPLTLVIVGTGFTLIFAINQLLNLLFYGSIWLIGIGEVDRARSPIVYWIACLLLFCPFIVLVVVGIYLASRAG